MKKFKLKSKPTKVGKEGKGAFSALKRGITLTKLSKLWSISEMSLWDKVLQYILSRHKVFKGDEANLK